MWIKYNGKWEDVAKRRHIISAHYKDTDDFVVAKLDSGENLRPNEIEITSQEFQNFLEEIKIHNNAVPDEAEPVDEDEEEMRAALKNPNVPEYIKALIRKKGI